MQLESASVANFEHWHTVGGSTTDGPSGTFAYRLTLVEGGVLIVLKQENTGLTKEFFVAGHSSYRGLHSHMQSLTDELCLSWFSKREKKPKKNDKQVKDPQDLPVQEEGK